MILRGHLINPAVNELSLTIAVTGEAASVDLDIQNV